MREPPEIRPWVAMNVFRRWAIAVVSVLIGGAAADPAAPRSVSLVRVADIPLGGNTTRLDYESLDPGRHLLDRKSTRLNSSHITPSRMPSSA